MTLFRDPDPRFFYGAAGLLYAGLAGLFFRDLLFFYPRGIHEWAQADRLALALSFYDRGFNFFKPATFHLNAGGGITGVEFPLPAYLAAWGGLLLGRQHISFCYRLLDTLLVLAAFMSLFHFVFRRTRRFLLALLPGLFLLSSPVFAYYTCNYLPDAGSAALLLMGACCFLDSDAGQLRPAIVCLLLLTLAALLKLTAGIYFLAIFALLLTRVYGRGGALGLQARRLLGGIGLAGLALVLGYTLYNQYLNQRYQSGLFLAQARPIDSWETFHYILFRIRTLWRYEYFTSGQYVFLAVCLALAGAAFIRRPRPAGRFGPLLLLALAGCLAYFYLMGRQFIDHDYYFITSGLPLVLLVVLLALWQLPWLFPHSRLPELLLLALSAVFVYQGYRHLQWRQGPVYKDFSQYYRYPWMLDGARALAQAGIPAEARLLVLNSEPPNLALVYFDRQGMVWQSDRLLPALAFLQQHGLDYVLMEVRAYDALPDKEAALQVCLRNARFVLLEPGPEPPAPADGE